jgi:preprotein translocase subunit SecD
MEVKNTLCSLSIVWLINYSLRKMHLQEKIDAQEQKYQKQREMKSILDKAGKLKFRYLVKQKQKAKERQLQLDRFEDNLMLHSNDLANSPQNQIPLGSFSVSPINKACISKREKNKSLQMFLLSQIKSKKEKILHQM